MINWFSTYKFAHPWVLWLIPVLIIGIGLWYYFLYKKQFATFTVSSIEGVKDNFSIKAYLKKGLPFLRLFALLSILIALARPQTTDTDQNIQTYGIDIVFSMDISASMLAQDFKPNRLEVAKEVASNFIAERPSDRMGIVIFSGESFTQVPLTTDKIILKEQMEKIKQGVLQDGTAIGMGIATAINRLKESDAKSKVIILMTDGVNNSGLIDPKLATEIALQYDVKIYTIGIGSKGTALMPAYLNDDGTFEYDYMPVEIDEFLLNEIAEQTGGKYYRAENKDALEAIYNEIDQLEKTEIESSQTIRVEEQFYPFAFIALILFFVEVSLAYTLLRNFP